jgi:hypothetical protein
MCYAAAIGASIVGRTSAPGVVRVAGCKGFERLWYYNSWAKMSKRKGMSLDEKRVKLLEVFHDSADVFVLKVRVWGAGCLCAAVLHLLFGQVPRVDAPHIRRMLRSWA